MTIQDAALRALRELVGRNDAEFHEGQFEAISALVDERRRALVVQRTGWGKSAVYFVSTLLLRQQGAGPTILVSPLLALMRDQISAARRAGVRAVAINSTNPHEWAEIAASLDADTVDVLLVSPERLNNPDFRDSRLPGLVARAGLLVIDEAHCISDWGHDFRPDYRRLRELIASLPASVPVLATTATANQRVVADIEEQLSTADTPVRTIRGSLGRSSLRLGVLALPDAETRLAWLLEHLSDFTGSGIVYTLTVSAAVDTARLLRDAGHDVVAYTGQTDPDEREQLENRLRSNDVKALIATSALGMGFDKPDLGFVIHLGAPSSPVAYYQQVGRAGRATESADVLLLPGSEDRAIWTYFATASMPREDRALAVLDELSVAATEGHPLSTPALEARVNISRTPLELLLKVLDVDGAVTRVKGGWLATGRSWVYDAERYARISAARSHEQQAMLDYEALSTGPDGCRMSFLRRELDDETGGACGRCDNCAGVWFDSSVGEAERSGVAQALSKVGVVIDPRAQWPTGMERFSLALKGNIPPGARAEPGRAVGRLSDLGWGGALRPLFAEGQPDGPASPELLAACIRVLAEWGWSERPTAIVTVPSRRHPRLVESVAENLATVGRLPWIGSLAFAGGGPTGSPGGNSAFRLHSVFDRFSADALDVPAGPVLLVDDLVDSRWTITVASRALRAAGATAVLPFALALRA